MRWLLSLTLVLFGSLLQAQVVEIPLAKVGVDRQELHEDNWKENRTHAVVLVRAQDREGFSCGSGTHLGDRLVLTAAHVIRGVNPNTITVTTSRGVTRARVLALSGDSDSCLLEMEQDLGLPATPIASEEPQINETLFCAGFSHAGPLRRWMARLRERWGGVNCEASPGAISGDSGGPVFNDKGELVGNLWGNGSTQGTQDGSGTTIYVSNITIRRFLRPWVSRLQVVVKTQYGGCFGGTCPPQQQFQMQINPPVRQQPQNNWGDPPSITPPAQPPASSGAGVQVDLDKLAAVLVDKYADKLRGLPGKDGASGKDGEPGPPGRDGLNGVNGLDGKDATLSPEQIAELVSLVEQRVLQKIGDETKGDSMSPNEQMIYITSAACKECRKADEMVEMLKAKGAPITIVTLTEQQAATKGVPVLYIPSKQVKKVGLSNVLTYLSLVSW